MENEENIQEYSRYRNATHCSSKKILNNRFYFQCYSQSINQNENEYSRYRNSQSKCKKSSSKYLNAHLIPHYLCRSLIYNQEAERFPVPDNKVFWNATFCDYVPFEYTTKRVQNNPKADPIDSSKVKKFNEIDEKVDRRSFMGIYFVDPKTNRPRNPIGRTGMTGRGRLYFWGPNHAGDCVVTRWLRDSSNSIVYRRDEQTRCLKPVLEFVAIERKDTKQLALPGGMTDPGEEISETIKREFQEEVIGDEIDENIINQLFSNSCLLFKSYVDDPRNTDNSWIETVALNYHDETGQLTKDLKLTAGDDAQNAYWHPVDRQLQLYASHKEILKKAVDRLDAFW